MAIPSPWPCSWLACGSTTAKTKPLATAVRRQRKPRQLRSGLEPLKRSCSTLAGQADGWCSEPADAAAGIRSRTPSQRLGRRPQVIAIPPITATAIENRLQRLIQLIRLIRHWRTRWRTSWPNSYSRGWAELPAGMAQSHYGLSISARSGPLDRALPAIFARSQSLLDQRLDQRLELERQLAEPWHHRSLPTVCCRGPAVPSGACCSNQKVSPPPKAATGSCANINYYT